MTRREAAGQIPAYLLFINSTISKVSVECRIHLIRLRDQHEVHCHRRCRIYRLAYC